MEVRVPSLLALFFFFFFFLLAVSLPLFLSAQCIRTQRFVACFCSRSPACRFSPVCTGVRAEREFLSVPFIYICIYVCTKESSIQGNRGARNSTWSNGSVEREKTVYFCLSFLPSRLAGLPTERNLFLAYLHVAVRVSLLRILRRPCEALRFVAGSYNGVLNSKRVPFPSSPFAPIVTRNISYFPTILHSYTRVLYYTQTLLYF